jgi:hypothetical protein
MSSAVESPARGQSGSLAATTGEGHGEGTGSRSLRWWPALSAIALTALVVSGMSSGTDVAPVLAASGLVYLGAAALQRPSAAWPVFLVTFVVITASRQGWVDVDATWVLLGLAGVLVAYALIRSALRPGGGLPLQAIAMFVFGGAAAIALLVNERAGAFLVAAGLFGHAAWDVHHHRANKVVVRSLAEFCFVLDTLLAAAIVVVTLRG